MCSSGCATEEIVLLAEKSGRDVVKILQRRLKDQGCTILLVTYDNRTLDIADRIIYMEDGRLMPRPEEQLNTVASSDIAA